ncbi:hypothetical protein JXA34_01665 [Patescibacteria group bacterium]|nr:hypothetical protein [Patescibacteria group bacterium]
MSVKTFSKGLGFGLTSGVITTLGLIIGLGFSTESKLAVITGILTIALADSFSDALGIHISEEAQGAASHKEVWGATLYTLLFKIIFSLTFLIPVLILPLKLSLLVCCVWGLLVLGVFSYVIGKRGNKNPLKVILEHLTVTLFVIVVTYLLGILISRLM